MHGRGLVVFHKTIVAAHEQFVRFARLVQGHRRFDAIAQDRSRRTIGPQSRAEHDRNAFGGHFVQGECAGSRVKQENESGLEKDRTIRGC